MRLQKKAESGESQFYSEQHIECSLKVKPIEIECLIPQQELEESMMIFDKCSSSTYLQYHLTRGLQV